jgi:hypothetical protein
LFVFTVATGSERHASEGITQDWLTGVRATQAFFLHNPIARADRLRAEASHVLVPEYPGDPDPRLKEFILDNIKWHHWNPQVDLQDLWQGITRFESRKPGTDEQSSTLVTWLEGRWLAEDPWRVRESLAMEYMGTREMTGWPNATLMSQRLGPVHMAEIQEIVQFLQDAQNQSFKTQFDLMDIFLYLRELQ